jgi:hypothetical protein
VLSSVAGLFCAIVPAIELSVFRELLYGIDDHFAAEFLAFIGLIGFGWFVFFWCIAEGPPRPGRGIIGDDGVIRNDTAQIFGAMVFNFFFFAGIVLAIVYWTR